MISETPCLSGCRCKCGDLLYNGAHHAIGNAPFQPESHAPNCPNAQPAEPPACKCGGNLLPNVVHTPDGCYSVPPQSEPPIDHRFEAMHAAWKAEQAISIALRAERDAFYMDYRLKCDAETKALHEENTGLRARVEQCEEIRDALLAGIKARKEQEASNG